MYRFKKSKFLILIPAYNELKNLKKFVNKVNNLAPVFILDDCSTDNTEEWLIKNKINFIKNKKNLGYEKNLLNGIKKFKKYSEYLVTFDGDGQHKISDLKKVLSLNTNYDILICNRKNKNRFLENLISFQSKILFDFYDPLSGFKVYKTNKLNHDIFIDVGEFFLVDFLLKFLKYDSKITNYSITTNKRIGISRVGNFFPILIKELKILFKLILIKINSISS